MSRRPEQGQTLVVVVLFMITLLMFAGVVIDGGNFLLQRRNLQGNADAAALAGVADLPTSQAAADTTARNYVTDNNSADGASVDTVTTTSNTVKVTTKRTGDGQFLKIFGIASPTIKATATAEVTQVAAMSGMLPFGIMKDAYTIGTMMQVRDNVSERRGLIYPNAGSPCAPANGGNDDRQLIKGEFASGGMIACADPSGTVINTAPGWKNGNVKAGFDGRVGGNTDSFTDIFQLDPGTGRYVVKLPNSPRIGIVPIIENLDHSTTWNKNKQVRILDYMVVYIGETGVGGIPPYTNNGKEVWLTPVNIIAPDDIVTAWKTKTTLGTYDPTSMAPIIFRLTQ